MQVDVVDEPIILGAYVVVLLIIVSLLATGRRKARGRAGEGRVPPRAIPHKGTNCQERGADTGEQGSWAPSVSQFWNQGWERTPEGLAQNLDRLLLIISGNIALVRQHLSENGQALTRIADAEKASVQAKDLVRQLFGPLPDGEENSPTVPEDAPTQKKVLVIDEAPQVGDVIGAMIRCLGYGVTFAHSYPAAMELYQQAVASGGAFDLVILEATVNEEMTHGEALRVMKEINPSVKVVASNSYGDDPLLQDPEKSGFAATIAKPYDMEELGRLLRRLLS